MLPILNKEIGGLTKPLINKYSENFGDASLIGAFPFGDIVTFKISLPRRCGVLGIKLRIAPDDGEVRNIPLLFSSFENGMDTYSVELDTSLLTNGLEDGLFFYDFVFVLQEGELFTDSVNNVDFELSEQSGNRFQLMVYRKDFKTPSWLSGGIMYQIFVDRFFRGEGCAELRDDCLLEPDWDNGIPQFAENPGEPLKNNVFFGGNLWGVAQKLPYLRELGVSVIYLCPIFKAYSNHKYDTGDYLEVDPGFGGDKAFKQLIKCAKDAGIRIILDGVFNHTGDDSKYFNKYGTYGTGGAYLDRNSEYAGWYNFRDGSDSYESWWGIEILPRLNHENENCRKFFTAEGGVAEKYIKMGIDGWRLDVADELSDRFLDEFAATVKHASDGEAVIIGEVWENASNKISYGIRRKYLRGGQLDSVMNYPFRSAVIEYIRMADSSVLADELTGIWSMYPRTVCDSLMNIIGTHDTERILTVLGGTDANGRNNRELSKLRMSPGQRFTAKKMLKIVSTLQYTVYGIPSVYYGDEVGLEGYHDPFCRMPYPWKNPDKELLEHYKKLGRIRSEHKAYDKGDFLIVRADRGFIAFERRSNDGSESIYTASNVGDRCESLRDIISVGEEYEDLLSGEIFTEKSRLEPDRAVILIKKKANSERI